MEKPKTYHELDDEAIAGSMIGVVNHTRELCERHEYDFGDLMLIKELLRRFNQLIAAGRFSTSASTPGGLPKGPPSGSEPRPADFLRHLASIQAAKDREYDETYLRFGEAAMAVWGEVNLKTAEDHGRFVLMQLQLIKFQRYGAFFKEGGHADSLIDQAIYSTMLMVLDCRAQNGKN